MREAIRDIDRLQHMLEQIDALLDLVHEYYQVSKEGLWDTLTNDLPELRPYIVRYIAELK